MITARLMTTAQGAVRDAQSNNISLFNIIQEIKAASFPIFFQRMFVVAFLEREADDPSSTQASLEIRIGANVLDDHSIDLNFGEKHKTRLVTEIVGLAIPQPGELKFTLKAGESEIGSWSISISQVPGLQLELQTV